MKRANHERLSTAGSELENHKETNLQENPMQWEQTFQSISFIQLWVVVASEMFSVYFPCFQSYPEANIIVEE